MNLQMIYIKEFLLQNIKIKFGRLNKIILPFSIFKYNKNIRGVKIAFKKRRVFKKIYDFRGRI